MNSTCQWPHGCDRPVVTRTSARGPAPRYCGLPDSATGTVHEPKAAERARRRARRVDGPPESTVGLLDRGDALVAALSQVRDGLAGVLAVAGDPDQVAAQVEAARTGAAAEVAAVRAELAAERAAHQATAEELGQVRAETARLAADLAEARAETDRMTSALEMAAAERDQAAEQARTARAAAEQARAETDAAVARAAQAAGHQARAERAEGQLAALTGERDHLKGLVDRLAQPPAAAGRVTSQHEDQQHDERRLHEVTDR